MTTYLGKSCSFCLPRVPFVNCRQFMYLVISFLVLRAGYWIWLYQFLIIAYLYTLWYLLSQFLLYSIRCFNRCIAWFIAICHFSLRSARRPELTLKAWSIVFIHRNCSKTNLIPLTPKPHFLICIYLFQTDLFHPKFMISAMTLILM